MDMELFAQDETENREDDRIKSGREENCLVTFSIRCKKISGEARNVSQLLRPVASIAVLLNILREWNGVKLMKCALSIMLVLILSVVAVAGWIVISLEDAVGTSDVIVIGTLHDVSEETRDSIDYGSGEITVDEVLWGDVAPGRKLILVWQNGSYIDCPRVEHRDHQNKQAIWLLTVKPEGKVAADNPGRFVSIEKKGKVLELLRERRKI